MIKFDDSTPSGLLPRRGGHAWLNQEYSAGTGSDPRSQVGFTIFQTSKGNLEVSCFSRGLNGPFNRASSGSGYNLSPEIQNRIITKIQETYPKANVIKRGFSQ